MAIGGETVLTMQVESGTIGADLAVIKGTADNQIALPGAANVRAIGVTGLAGDASDPKKTYVPVIILGPAKVTAGAAITAGSFVKIAGTSGKVAAVGGESADTQIHVVGLALTSAAADGDVIDILVMPFTYYKSA